MRIIRAIIKTGLITSLMSVCSFTALALLFNDIIQVNMFEVVVLLLLSCFVAGISTILIFVPIAVVNKNESRSLMDWVRNFLPVAVMPVVLVTASIFCNKPSLFQEPEFLFIFLNCIIGYYTSFLIFFHSLVNKKS